MAHLIKNGRINLLNLQFFKQASNPAHFDISTITGMTIRINAEHSSTFLQHDDTGHQIMFNYINLKKYSIHKT